MIGQIQITHVQDLAIAKINLNQKKKEIIKQANVHCMSMCKRGGGVVDVKARSLA